MTQQNHRRLAIGTAQFGLNYGVANQVGQVSLSDTAKILSEARSLGVDTLDTATLYGKSEEVLGQVGVDGMNLVSKLPGMPVDCPDIESWVFGEVRESLRRLGLKQLYGLLLHRPSELLLPQGKALYQALCAVKEAGLVQKIGVSVYSPDELAGIVGECKVGLIQAPLNILDRRLVRSGWLSRLKEMGIEVHVRSVFLQGLLLMSKRPARFSHWSTLLDEWDLWVRRSGRSPLESCLNFALSFPEISRVVVGVDSLSQFREIAAASCATTGQWPDKIFSDDVSLINPSLWPKS